MPDTSVQLSDDIFAELRKIDTPTITNVVATYPKNPLCLGLYNPWTQTKMGNHPISLGFPIKSVAQANCTPSHTQKDQKGIDESSDITVGQKPIQMDCRNSPKPNDCIPKTAPGLFRQHK